MYAYAGDNPIAFDDPIGLSTATYDGILHTLTFVDSEGNFVGAFPANNNTTITSGGPWPEGTYPFSYYNPHPESNENGPFGSYGIFVFKVPGRSGMGIHSGRASTGAQNHPTLGCIRTTNDAMAVLQNLAKSDPLTSVTISNNSPNAPRGGRQQ